MTDEPEVKDEVATDEEAPVVEGAAESDGDEVVKSDGDEEETVAPEAPAAE